MRVEQTRYDPDGGWQPCPPGAPNDASLVLVFGSTAILKEQKNLDCVHAAYPGAAITGCSTAGEIEGTRVYDESLTVTAIRFDKAETRPAFAEIEKFEDSCETGRRLGASLDRDGLRYVLVLSDGLNVNGSELVQGLTENLPANVTITGGLAGDGARFQETLVVWDDLARSRAVVVIGLYGESLKIGCGSLGGWDSFWA